MIVNLAERAHNHNWRLDPITRSLLDTDFYKLLMLQFIWKHFPDVERHVYAGEPDHEAVSLAERIGVEELRMQLDNVRGLRFHKSELIWLAGNTFYGKRGIFEPEFLEWLENDFHCRTMRCRLQNGELTLIVSWLVDADDAVGGICAFDPERVEDPRQPARDERVFAGYFVCSRQGHAVEQDRASARRAWTEDCGFWHAAKA